MPLLTASCPAGHHPAAIAVPMGRGSNHPLGSLQWSLLSGERLHRAVPRHDEQRLPGFAGEDDGAVAFERDMPAAADKSAGDGKPFGYPDPIGADAIGIIPGTLVPIERPVIREDAVAVHGLTPAVHRDSNAGRRKVPYRVLIPVEPREEFAAA